MTDFAQQFVALVREVAPEAAPAAALIERELRDRFGGQRVRIDARAPLTLEAIDERLRQRMRVVEIAEDLGVSRWAIYRMLRTPKDARKVRKERAAQHRRP